jgi:hypothetical protein
MGGSSRGPFRTWLDKAPHEPRIAWYPSAGGDFRDIGYLSEAYARLNPAIATAAPPPDLFLHNDYMGLPSGFEADGILYRGRGSELRVVNHESLPMVELPVRRSSAVFPEGARNLGKVEFAEVVFTTQTLGTIEAALLYVGAENAALCARLMLPTAARISHVVNVRYGHGSGGAAAPPAWLLNVLGRLQTELFISDGHHRQSHERLAPLFRDFPELSGPCDDRGLTCVHRLTEDRWSNHGNVEWLSVPRMA